MSKHNPIDHDEVASHRAHFNLPSLQTVLLRHVDEDERYRAPNGRNWVAIPIDETYGTFLPTRSVQLRDLVFADWFHDRDCYPSPAHWRHAVQCWESTARRLDVNPALRVAGDGRSHIFLDTDGGRQPGCSSIHITPAGWSADDNGLGTFYRPSANRFFKNPANSGIRL